MPDKILDSCLLKTVFAFEAIFAVLIAIGFSPREFSWLLTLIIVVYIIGANIKDSLRLALLSVPFYLALPMTNSFDSMANWRIILAALFLAWFVKSSLWQKTPDRLWHSRGRIRQFLIKNWFYGFLSAFLIIASLSLFGAQDAVWGIKKILFLVNIFLLFVIVKDLTVDQESFLKILKTAVLAGAFSLFIGYLQMASIFVYSLSQFWQFWAENVITALYGTNLSILLSYSNTWFSYYPGDIPPTLRMFSVFPDSHSFALFLIILIPFVLTFIFYSKNEAIRDKRYSTAGYLTAIAILLGIIFSGTRGAWISALVPLIILIAGKRLIFGKEKEKIARIEDNNPKYKKIFARILNTKRGILISSLILFFALFPVSSAILEQTQKIEWRRLNSGGEETFALYKRFESIIDLDEISNKGRLEIWQETLKSIEKHPLLGIGIGNFPTVLDKNIASSKKGASAHNLFLDITAETGILGLLAFLAVFYEILETAFGIFRNSKNELFGFYALSFGVYLFWVLGYSIFDVVLFNDKVLMMFMVGVGLLYGIKNIEIMNQTPVKIEGNQAP